VVTGIWGGEIIMACLLVATINHQRRVSTRSALPLSAAA
jgi:hypothetical protein